MNIEAIIFDLDGVIVSTDECHYKGWKRLAEEERIYFNREINMRIRGVSRRGSIEVLLENATRTYTEVEILEMMERKNSYYREYIKELKPSDVPDAVRNLMNILKEEGIKLALGSSSKNCRTILGYIGLGNFFDVVVDGNDISKSKPDPEVFVKAAQQLGVTVEKTLVVEDADAGVEAGKAGRMKVLGVGPAASNQLVDRGIKSLGEAGVLELIFKV